MEENMKQAIAEAVDWHSVVIDVSLASGEGPKWGTGALIKTAGKIFIVACRHVVKPQYKNEDLRFLYRPNSTLIFENKEEVRKVPFHKIDKAYSRTIPVAKRFYSDETDDLALIELDPSTDGIKDLLFSQVTITNSKTPKVSTQVFLMGFSEELARKVTKHGDRAVFPYFEATKITDKKISSDDFDTKRHFLIDFAINEASVDPHGLSGCGVWSRLPPEKDRVWTANIYLIGIQTGYFKENQVLKATKIERLINLLNMHDII